MADGDTVADKIADIAASKAAIAQAISAKGVTVPSGAKLAELAAKVGEIETGGGDAGAIALWETDRTTATSITIPEGPTKIGDYAFYNCSALTSITIPEGPTKIGDNAFFKCSALTSLTLPKGLTSIGNYAFAHCYALKSLIIPEGVTTIDSAAFYGCFPLTSLTLPNSVTTIGSTAFYGCPAKCDITFAKTMAEVSGMSNYPWGISSGAVIHCTDGDLTVV